MIDINIYESQTCKTVSFGRKGENLARRIMFDMSALVAEFGAGSFEWVIRRPHESTVYIAVNKAQDGNTAILNLTTTETAISGYGGLELRYYVDDVIVKTIVWRTSIAASLGGGDVPDPIEDYIDQMREIAQEASESADAAGDSATQAAVSAANASGSASQAAGYAANAAASARAAADSATDSAEFATEAYTSETNAANSATQASEFAIQAANSASAASGSASQAASSVTQAAGSASAAANSATQAAQSATAAANSATAAATSAQDIAASSAQIETNRTDITDLKNQKADAIINSASGAIASFNDGADDVPVKDLKVRIEPVQSGSGDPSPDNVRPISGWTGCEVNRTGVNVWDEEWQNGRWAGNNGVLNPAFSSYVACKNKIPVKPNTTYYFTISGTVSSAREIVYYDVNENWISDAPSFYQNATFITPSNAYYITFNLGGVYGATYNHDTSINYPSTDTAYHAYQGETINVDWESSAGTVYGGTLDVTTGVLTVDRAMVTLTGENSWAAYDEVLGKYFVNNVTENAKTGNRIKYITNLYPFMGYGNTQSSNVIHDKHVYGQVSYNRVWVYDSAYNDLESFKAALNATPLQFVYSIETPIMYQLTPTEVRTLLKQNSIFADTGDIASVDYVADTKTYIDAKTSAAQKLMELIVTANREDSMTASANHSIGDLIIVEGTLYKATAAIASGATMTAGTNVAQTTIAAELAALA